MSRVKKISVWDVIPEEAAQIFLNLIYARVLVDSIRLPRPTVSKTETVADEDMDREIEKFRRNIGTIDAGTGDFRTSKHKNHYADTVKGWRYVGGKKYYYRSLWEINFSRYLQYQKECGNIRDWEYEPTTFLFKKISRGRNSYKPDFRTYGLDGEVIYYEVKGWMDKQSKTKITRMKKYYPDVTLKIIDAKWFATKGKSMAVLIEGWERKEVIGFSSPSP